MTQSDSSLNIGHQVAQTCEAPTTDAFTPYDEAHFALYLGVLHAKAEGTPDPEIAQTLFGIDPAREPERASRTVEAHYRRALWFSGPGARHILEEEIPAAASSDRG